MGFCDIPGMGVLCDPVTDGLASSITDSIGNWIASSIADLATSGVDLATKGINATTAIDLNTDWFRHNYELLLPIGLTVTVLTFVLQLIRAAWRRDGGALAQAVTGTFSGVLFSFAAIALTSVALTVTDALSNGLFQAGGTSLNDAIRRLVKISEISGTAQLGWVVAAVIAVGCAIGTFLYWGMMMLRKVTVLVLVTLAVFVGAGGGWEAAQRWRRGWIEATATVVFSKLLMTVIFLLGVSAIGQPDTSSGINALSDMLAGITVMALVLMCPFAVYRFVHWAGDAQHADLHQSTAMGLSNAAAKAQKTYATARTAATGTAGAAGAGAAGGAAGGAQAPGTGSPQGPHAENPGGGQPGGKPTTFRFNSRTGADASGSGDQAALSRESGDRGVPLLTRGSAASTPARATPPDAAGGNGASADPAGTGTPSSAGQPDSAAPAARLVVFPSPTPPAAVPAPGLASADPSPATPSPTGPAAPAASVAPESPSGG